MEKIVFKAIILSILPLISILILVTSMMNYMIFVDTLTIEEYHRLCAEYIYQELTTQESYIRFGMVITTIAGDEIVLPTFYYDAYIINENEIRFYLEQVSWPDLILKHNFDVIAVKELILKEYVDAMLEAEKLYFITTTTRSTIQNAQLNACEIIINYLQSLNNIEKIVVEDIMKVLKEVDWVTYIQTTDYQSKELYHLKNVCYDRILFHQQSSVIITKPPSNLDLVKEILQILEVIGPLYTIAKSIKMIIVTRNVYHETLNFLQGLLVNKHRIYMLTNPKIRKVIRIALDFVEGYYFEQFIDFYISIKKRKKEPNILHSKIKELILWFLTK